MERKKVKLYIDSPLKISYQAPYYIVGGIQYHEDWYEVVYEPPGSAYG